MASTLKPIVPIRDADSKEFNLTDEQKYWVRMEEQAVFEESGNVTSCDFMPSQPFHLASTSSNRLTVFDTSNFEPASIYSRFKAPVLFAKYRNDGALLGASTSNGSLQFFDVHSEAQKKHGPRNAIRTFKAHNCQIGCFDYEPNGRRVASMGDDGVVKLFDLAADNSEPVWSCQAHNDFIRTGCFSTRTEHLLATGSYDHTVRLWDIRVPSDESEAVREFNHGAPVERVLFLPNKKLLASAGGSIVKIWSLKSGRLVHELEMHKKTVTSLCLATEGTCLLMAGIDKRVNVIRLEDYELIHTFKAKSPVLSLAIDQQDKFMAFGMGNKLAIHMRKDEKLEEHKKKRKRKRPKEQTGFEEESMPVVESAEKISRIEVKKPVVVEKEKGGKVEEVQIGFSPTQLDKMHLGKLDYLLREGSYRELVSRMLTKNASKNKPELLVAIFQQIRIRQQLRRALSELGRKELVALFTFIDKHLLEAPFFEILSDVADCVLDIYVRKPLSKDIRWRVKNLLKSLNTELCIQSELGQTIGTLQILRTMEIQLDGKSEADGRVNSTKEMANEETETD